MIRNFKCKETEKVWNKQFSKKLAADIQDKAIAKLLMLDAANVLSDLTIPPNNRLEKLKKGRYREDYPIDFKATSKKNKALRQA